MPKKFPPEFKRDVVRVARRGDLSQAEVSDDVGAPLDLLVQPFQRIGRPDLLPVRDRGRR
ncbi:hypothetical protein [Blastococcus sp. CT_GayMR19]|uniref:hypothetical protein n=1 Tax=Blastococcus sp. CT_GayMR19 TaxID=2559608 RepID=UPI001FD84B6F|nr:hypothetical protein [Blastococcus sp. CT_GayMR19]